MKPAFSFNPKLIVRTPALPFVGSVNRRTIEEKLQYPAFREALYLASPNLYNECLKWQAGELTEKEIEKTLYSVAKYHSRMSTRCTPFGLLAGCSVVQWSNQETEISLSKSQRHTRFDMHYLCSLAQHLACLPYIKDNLTYFPNSSSYVIGEEIRYIEYSYVDSVRHHQISAVGASPYISKVLEHCQQGASFVNIVNALSNEDISKDEATAFVNNLIACQLLVHNLEPAITGEEFIYQIIEVLKNIYSSSPQEEILAIIDALNNIENEISCLDQKDYNLVQDYHKVKDSLRKIGVPFEENKLFQTDLIKTTAKNRINTAFQQELLGALEILTRLSPKQDSQNLTSFAKRFYERYENAEMPLLQVLDTETGIGYLELGSVDNTPLVEDLILPANKDLDRYDLEWNKIQKWLFGKLEQASREKQYSVEITKDEVQDFKSEEKNLPPSISAMFRVVDSSLNTLYLEGFSGSSAANLLGRFAHGDTEIYDLVCDITHAEQRLNPDVIFAEIVHLPESRVGNILLHPVFRHYEIPYLAKSSLPQDHQIDLHDLYVSVVNDRVILRSKRLNKEIIPRLSTAHNYSYKALPVYQFLCELQTQGQRTGFGFNWGNLSSQFKFLPRVVHKNTILHPATWQLFKEDILSLNEVKNEVLLRKISAFKQQWKMPQYLTLADGDNELFIDLTDVLSIRTWLSTVKNREHVILKEFFFDNSSAVVDGNGGKYANQFVASLIKETATYTKPNVSASRQQMQPIQRSFAPGSEWVYYKLYCGVRSADTILTEVVKPVVEELKAGHLIDQWFFIRYADPGLHLRIRFHLPDATKIGEVLRCLHSYKGKFEQENVIYKSQLDTYQREIERYGSNTIDMSEAIFWHDSESILAMLDSTWGDEREAIRWLWGMKAIDGLMDDFQVSTEQRVHLFKGLKNGFAAEFNMDKALKLQIDKKYRNYRMAIESVMNKENEMDHELYPLFKIIRRKSSDCHLIVEKILETAQIEELEVSLDKLLSSYVHMLLNRLIPSNQRLHEMVVYDFLYRHYHSSLARHKKKKAKIVA